MTKSIFFLLVFFFGISALSLNAQDKWSVRTSFGTASGIGPVDGFYYSFDIGIPIVRSLEIAPTFNFFSTVPTERLDNSWVKLAEYSNYLTVANPKNHYSGDVMGSMSLVLLFKPLAFSDNPKVQKHELAFGAGLGIKSYATVRSTYEKTGMNYELVELGAKSAWTVEPYFAKVFYNYHFSNKFFAGPVASLDGFDGEAVALFGIQLGINP